MKRNEKPAPVPDLQIDPVYDVAIPQNDPPPPSLWEEIKEIFRRDR